MLADHDASRRAPPRYPISSSSDNPDRPSPVVSAANPASTGPGSMVSSGPPAANPRAPGMQSLWVNPAASASRPPGEGCRAASQASATGDATCASHASAPSGGPENGLKNSSASNGSPSSSRNLATTDAGRSEVTGAGVPEAAGAADDAGAGPAASGTCPAGMATAASPAEGAGMARAPAPSRGGAELACDGSA